MQVGSSAKAVVLGGSMAGLMTARVLARHFGRVTIVERDGIVGEGGPRRGVPQGRHTHGLLSAGRAALEALFPGLFAELLAGGAVPGDLLRSGRWFFEGGHLAQRESGLEGVLVSRPALEEAVRNRVLGLPRIELRQATRAESLLFDEPGERVTGVRLSGGVIGADLVVDATGRGSRAPQWLQRAGYPAPEEEKVEVDDAYTTRLFHRSPASLGGDIAVVVPATPEGKVGGVMLAQEGDRWTVTLVTYFGGKPPEDVPGFVDFASRLPCGDIHAVIRSAEPIGEAASYTFPASLRRRYEKLARFPEGFLVVGDGICSFNPMYGQGMSTAALQAAELDALLPVHADDLRRRFFARASRVVDIPWTIAAGGDLRIPEVRGPRTAGASFVNWYLARLHRAAHRDPELARAFLRVTNLVAQPPSVMHPRLALRVLLGGLGEGSFRSVVAGPGAASAPPSPRRAPGTPR